MELGKQLAVPHLTQRQASRSLPRELHSPNQPVSGIEAQQPSTQAHEHQMTGSGPCNLAICVLEVGTGSVKSYVVVMASSLAKIAKTSYVIDATMNE